MAARVEIMAIMPLWGHTAVSTAAVAYTVIFRGSTVQRSHAGIDADT